MTSMGAGESVKLAFLSPEAEAGCEPPAPAIQWPEGVVTAETMGLANRTGVAVHAWTVNEPSRMAELLDIHVHGIITDDPAALEKVLAQSGLGE